MQVAGGAAAGDEPFDEFGAPMTADVNYLANHNGAVEQSYFAAVTDLAPGELARSDSIGT